MEINRNKKLFEVAKEFDMKHTEFIPLLNECGYDFNPKGFSKEIEPEVLEKIMTDKKLLKRIQEENALKNFKDENDFARFIGTYFNPETRKYEVYKLNLTKEQLDQISPILVGEFTTVYNAKSTLSMVISDQGLLLPSPMEKVK